MRGWLRVLVVAVLAGVVLLRFAQESTLQALERGESALLALRGTLAEGGATIVEKRYDPNSIMASAAYFVRSGCDSPSTALPFSVTYDPLPAVKHFEYGKEVISIHYARATWPELNRLTLFTRVLPEKLMERIPGSGVRFTQLALLVADPADCAAPQELDFSGFWKAEAS